MRTILILFVLVLISNAQAESKRVQVFEKSQQYWDVITGQSLSGICQQLQAAGTHSQTTCQQQILKMNPDAFINKKPNRLIAGKRLWLPGSYRPVSKLDNKNYHIKNFSWGSIKTPK
ncbi:MAG: hypothetical protein KAU21_15195 [Gammaproteobacteria bacterium]|nr:hypothetical protein [Gammaproteobacteria bacterium]